jgi:hypothetical protein
MLVFSMVWLGSETYLPVASAETTTSPVQENPAASTLTKLEIEGIELSQKFSGDLFEYSAAVENKVQTIKLLVEGSNTDSSITINGQEVISGTASNYPLQTGVNIFQISVTDESSSAKVYTLTITREESSNNLLQNIELSQGNLSPEFSSSVTEYNATVPNGFPRITIKSTSVEPTSTIKVNGTTVVNERGQVELPVGKSDIIIEVTAKNGEKKTYSLHVTREAAENEKDKPNLDNQPDPAQPTTPKDDKPSIAQPTTPKSNRPSTSQPTSQQQSSLAAEKTSKALLTSLSVSEGTWDSTFTSEEFTYHVTVSGDVDAVNLNPVATYSSSEILIEGSSTSKTVKLDEDKITIISVVVKNDDDRKTYVLVFNK